MPECERLDGGQEALIKAVLEANDPVGPEESLSIILHNANPDVNFTKYGQSPLFVAANAGKRGAAEVLLRWPHPTPIDVNLRSDAGETPFLAACRGGHLDIVQLLVEHGGVEMNLKAADGRSGLWCASHNGHFELLSWLLDTQENLDWATEARGLKTGGGTTSCCQVARVEGHTSVIPLIQEGIELQRKRRAKERFKKASAIQAIVRIRGGMSTVETKEEQN